MSTHKHFDKICAVIVVLSLIVTVIFMNGEKLGITAVAKAMGYESRLFDAGKVHTIDIVMDDWDSFIETCENEEYAVCNVVIDGEAYKNVGIRAKGNTSLSTVSSLGSDRYSFKIEFDQYDNTNSYYGLDKLCLNNIIQDNTYMKDFLVYQLMADFGVAAPLCSYVYITVNGEDWGLYLAVEGIEDGFLSRNYGSNYGELYKPDSLSFGGGRGNGKDFDFSEIREQMEESGMSWGDFSEGAEMSDMGDGMTMPDMSGMTEGKMPSMPEGFDSSSMMSGGMQQMPGMQESSDKTVEGDSQTLGNSFSGRGQKGDSSTGGKMNFGGNFGGMGSDDVKLQYTDDNYESYSNIFDSAKTDITDADKDRLINSLKSLSNGEDIESVINIDEVLRYFVVHNFVVNGDSYTGSMVHNYYLYEEDGQLSMIPWDYNLAYGTFQSGNATDTVNEPIDSPVSGGSADDRPMVAWIFESEEYTEAYHEYFAEFIEKYFGSGYLEELINYTAEMIAPYVETDPTKFCTYEEFETGVETIKEFCKLRAESVSGQLEGTIPSTSEGQSADSSTLIVALTLSLSDMGTMSNGIGGGMMMPDMSEMPEGEMPTMPEGMEVPEGQQEQSQQQRPSRENMGSMTFPTGDNMVMPQTEGQSGAGEWIILGVTMAVLAAGLIFVFKFKR